MGRAEDIFNRIRNEGVSVVTHLIADAQTENLWLEFKRAGKDGRGSKLHESDWKNLAKALSGFANADGGVVLWGVDCKDDPVLGDVPTGPAPIEKPERFASWIENAISGCTVPAVPGVENHAISGSSGDGYVATLVPASPLAPHQCVKPAGSLNYYMRAGSTFVQVPHAVLSGMFGRRPHPKVFNTYQGTAVLDQTGAVTKLKIDLSIYAYNEGPAVARDVFVNLLMGVPGGPASSCRVQCDPDATGNWISHMSYGVLTSVISADSYRLAPQAHARVVRIHLDLAEPFESGYGMRLTIGCDGAPMHIADVQFDRDELQAKYLAAVGQLLEKRRDASSSVIGTFFGAVQSRG